MRIALPLAACVLLALVGGPACSEDAPARKKKPVKPNPVQENRLGKERSPYLRQHRHNPVDWFPWGEEAFAKAKAEDKPIFLSVGYAACHWCHVMEHESFEDEETARFLNDTFVCVKVDREERPDIDAVYMGFVQRRTGRGGWPMTVLLTPGRKPFWGATYLRSADLQQLCTQVKRLWKEQRDELQRTADVYAEQASDLAQGGERPETDDSDAKILETMRNAQTLRFDRTNGGFGGAPKFPPHADLLFFLDAGGARMGEDQRTQVFTTLDAMDRGGIHDQVGGGFHRYSTDAHWLLPHFEKMLYDNALLAQAYAMAFGLTKAPHYRRVVERLFAWLERELKQPGGGYASSLDADTEGEEGLTYTWTWKELAAVLTKDELGFLAPLLGLRADGNFHDEATHAPSGRNIPHWPKKPTQVARVDALLEKLHTVRLGRAQPGLDDKVIVGWNGLLLSAFARGGHALAAPAYLERGRVLATFLLERCRRPDGVLLRFPKESGAEIVGFCEDHVHVVDGLLDLADATGEARWADAARDLARQMNALFLDPKAGGFFATSTTHHEVLIAREKESWDSPIPSDNGVAARANLRLFARTQDRAFLEAAEGTLSAYRSTMADPRQSVGVMALIRALADRMEGAAGEAPLQGDVHLRRGVVQIDAFLERSQIKPGEKVGLVVRLALDKGWHVNAQPASNKDLIATRLAAAPGAVVALESMRYPTSVVRTLGGSDIALYEGTVEIRASLAIPADAVPGPRKLTLVLTFQPCDASTCQAPVEVELTLALRIDAAETGARRYPSVFK